jgi:regulator of sigma E protease
MVETFGNFLSGFGISAPTVLVIPAFLFVITVVVFFHELGHFVAARRCGVKVDVFSIGFGREIVGFYDRKGTRWKISWLPLGGYVKFAGDADPSSRSDAETLRNMDAAERAGSLHFKPVHQRAIVAAAGPLANFILAIAIFTVAFMISPSQPIEPPVIGEITSGSAADTAGFQVGDVIQSIDGVAVARFPDLQRIVSDSEGRQLRLGLLRNGEPIEILAAPRATDFADATGKSTTAFRLGIVPRYEALAFPQAFVRAVVQTWSIITRTVGYLGDIFVGRASTNELSGPLGIAKAAGDWAAEGFIALLNLTAFISVAIGFANLLPIPVLDGGHLLYYAFEAVLGRPLGERAQEVGFRLGLALVLCLMLLATFNDLVRFNLF